MLGPQSLIERFAVLWFITLDRPGRRTLFNPRQFPEQFGLGSQRLPLANFYIEDDDQEHSRLGYIVVDHGVYLRRIIQKSVRVLMRFLKRGWFDDYFAAGRFTLTVLTLNGAKQKSLSVLLGIPGLVTWACFSATTVREVFRRRSKGDIFREFVLVPALLWLIALASCTTRWETTAFLFLLVFAWPATLRAADLMATHALYYLSAQPRIDRATQIKWRSDWSHRFHGFSRPAPRRNDLHAEQRDDFHDLLAMRQRYRWGRWWLLAGWSLPVIWGWLLLGNDAEPRRLLVKAGIVIVLSGWAMLQSSLCPGSWSLFRFALASWIHFDFPPESPPWVFNTPVGDQRSRRFDARIAVVLIAMGFVPLTFGGWNSPVSWFDWCILTWGLLSSFVLSVVVFVLALFERGSGLSQFQGAFPMRTDWPVVQSEFIRRRDRLPWPAASDETVTIEPGWPAASEVTVTPTEHPGKVDDVLKGIREAAENN